MGIQLAPIEGTPFAGGTATGVIYLDANGLQRSDGPTVNASGDLTVGGNISATAQAITDTPVTINLAAAQSANATQVKDSGGTVLHFVDAGGGGLFTSPLHFDVGEYTYVKASTNGYTLEIYSRYGEKYGILGNGGWSAGSGKLKLGLNTNCGALTFKNLATTLIDAGVHLSADLGKLTALSAPSGYSTQNHGGDAALVPGGTSATNGDAGDALVILRPGAGTGVDSKFRVTDEATTTDFLTVDRSTGDVTVNAGNLTVSSPDIPASASATGTAGAVSWDADYIYICTATDTWKRVAIATW